MEKRIELACHTGYSRMRGLGFGSDWVQFAMDNGIDTLVITDCGNVDSYVDFQKEIQWKKADIKLIMGVDLSVVDDRLIEGKGVTEGRLSVLIINDTGRKNLYEILSEAERRNGLFEDEPKVPISLLLANRGGLLIGSGQSDGLLFKSIEEIRYAQHIPEEATFVSFNENIFDFLDYIEIPVSGINREICKDLIRYAEYHGIPAVAVNAPFHAKKNEAAAYAILNDIVGETDKHYRSTSDVLKGLEFLGEEKAYELAVTNTRLIADMCEVVPAIAEEKRYPYIEKQDEKLKEICFNALPTKYEKITTEIVDRLEWELNAIKSTSSAFIFIQLKEIFDRKALRPFEVSSRGSVGSSLAAYLCGFSEIDPIKAKLSPYFFYGYKGDREPDIDLNFRSGIQREIHKAFERVSGVETVIKAGTLGTISEKDADKLIDDYSEKHHKYFWTYRNEIKSCLTKTVKAKGQHPGGLILLPWGTEASDICPTKSIGYPPIRDEASAFDYHSIDHVIYKFDALGHDSPEIIHRLYHETSIDPRSISIDDPEVLECFKCNEGEMPICAGIPEFSTEFALKVLSLLEPKCFDDLVRLVSLVHGTDTWTGNAETLLIDGCAVASNILGDRNDVYEQLIEYGIEDDISFAIAEDVRKGKVSRGKSAKWKEWKMLLEENDVPSWFIWSCEQVKYMFPKAHSYSYMLSAWRMAWYKLHYPLEYYKVMLEVAYDSGFDAKYMAYGKERMDDFISFLKSDYAATTPFAMDARKTLTLLHDYYQHGYEFKVSDKELPNYEKYRIIDDHTIEVSVDCCDRDPDIYSDEDWYLYC